MSKERLAFDLRLYHGGGFGRSQVLAMAAADLASLASETAPKLGERIFHYEYFQDDQGKLYCPNYFRLPDDSVIRSLQRRVMKSKTPFLYFWFSPADKSLGWPESRMVVGFADYRDGRYRIDNYGFCPEPDLLEEECLRLVGVATVEELRKTPLFIDRPLNLSFIQVVEELMPMPKIWREIASGRAKKKTRKAIRAAERAVRKEGQVIFESGDHIFLGARLEGAMVKEIGRPMRPNSGCGALNSEVLGKLVFSKSSEIDKLQFGQKLERKKVFCKNCGLCGRPINRDIESGFCCPHCGGVYSGVC